MANQTFNQTLRLIIRADGGAEAIKTLNTINRTSRVGLTAQQRLNRITGTQFKQNTSQQLADIKVLAKARAGEAKRFKGEYMGFLFAGMAMQRAFGGLFKSMIAQYKEFTKETVTPLNHALTRLEANWKFLKFSMIDAASPILMSIADWMANMAHYASMLSPSTLSGLVVLIASLATLGGISMVFGQAALFFSTIASASAMQSGLAALNTTLIAAHGLDPTKLAAGTSFFNSFTTAAAVGSFAIGVSDTIQGIDKISEGDWIGSLLDAMEAGFAIWGGLEFLKGNAKKGGALVLFSFGFKALEAGTLFQGIGTIMGVVAGIMAGIGEVLKTAVAKLYYVLYGYVKGTFLETLFFPLGVNIEALQAVATKDYGKAFGDGFIHTFANMFAAGKQIDENLNSAREAGMKRFNEKMREESDNTFKDMAVDSDTLFNVTMPNNVTDFINSSEGMAGLNLSADGFNDNIGKEIHKTIWLHYKRSGGEDSEENAEINFTPAF